MRLFDRQARARRLRSLGPLVVSALVLAGCEDGPTLPEPPAFASVQPPRVGVTIATDLRIELDRPGLVDIAYGSVDGPTYGMSSDGAAEEHAFDLLRLRPGTSHTVVVTAYAADGSAALGESRVLSFETDPLPPELAALTFDVTGTPTMPLTMLEITVPQLDGAPIVVDGTGQIVWFREGSQDLLHGVGVLPEDRGFAVNTREGVAIIGPNQLQEAWLSESDAAARAGTGSFEIHHEVIHREGSEVLLLVHDTATVTDTVWTGEAIWSWDWESDVLTKLWSSFDHWSPVDHRGPRTAPWDWIHSNALSIGPRGNVLLSSFWTHEVASISADFSSIEWMLGGPVSTFLVADGAMDAGQHTPVEVAPNRVLLFDNGLDRPGGEQFSRAIELELDPVDGTAEVVWEFRPDPDVFAPIVGSVQRLDNGNTVAAFGTSPDFNGLPATGPIVVYEVDSAGDVVWRMEIGGASLLYRATPLASIGAERVADTGFVVDP